MPASVPARPLDNAAGGPQTPLVVLIESDHAARIELRRLLGECGLRVSEPDLDQPMPVQSEHIAAAAIVASYELRPGGDWGRSFTGLDLAVLIARRATRNIPTLVTSSDFGRDAIRACSPYRFPVMFKPLLPHHLHLWLRSVSLLTGTPPVVSPARGAA